MAEQEWRAEWASVVSEADVRERLDVDALVIDPLLVFQVDEALREAERERNELRAVLEAVRRTHGAAAWQIANDALGTRATPMAEPPWPTEVGTG